MDDKKPTDDAGMNLTAITSVQYATLRTRQNYSIPLSMREDDDVSVTLPNHKLSAEEFRVVREFFDSLLRALDIGETVSTSTNSPE